jgi:hypothetical protein
LGIFADGDEADLTQDAQVFAGARLGEAEVPGDLGDLVGALKEEVEDVAPCGFGKDVEAHAREYTIRVYVHKGM